MNVKPLLILSLFSLLFLAVGISKANVSSTAFTIILEDAGGIEFHNTDSMNLTITVASGTLNSTESYLTMTTDKGSLQFNSSQNVVLNLYFNGCQASVSVNDVQRSSEYGELISANSNDKVEVSWRWQMADLIGDWFIPGMGLGGIALMLFGGFWAARQIRNFSEVTILNIGWAMMIIFVGLGLTIGWLW